MPGHTYKSAAVPFVNQKGERSMKRVKVERYVAGKKPSFANDDDEDEYTTDDGETSEEEEELSQDEEQHQDKKYHRQRASSSESEDLHHKPSTSKYEPAERINSSQHRPKEEPHEAKYPVQKCEESSDEEDDDDPRFRRLKELQKKAASTIPKAESSSVKLIGSSAPRYDELGGNVVLDEDDDEEEIRQRHLAARNRAIDEPIGVQAVLGDIATRNELDPSLSELDNPAKAHSSKREQTEDILKDLRLSGLPEPRQRKSEEKVQQKQKLDDMLAKARAEGAFRAQVLKKVEEDNKKEHEKEILNKGDIRASDIASVRTDDEDEELAYEEWKLREIKRVLRDRSERALEKTKAK